MCKNELGDPTPEELIQALQRVNEALHEFGGAWQLLPGNVRSRLVIESQKIENVLDRAGALRLPNAVAARDERLRHLPPPRPDSGQTKAVLLGRRYRKGEKPVFASAAHE